MNEFDYTIITELYDKKIITTVANNLFISQPALTKRLNKIESELGRTLFNRTKKGVTFTQYGELVYEYCKANLYNKEELIKALNTNDKMNKILELGCSTAFALYKLPDILNEFSKEYTDTEILVNSQPSYDTYQYLLKGDINIAIIREDYPWEGKKIKLCEEPVCLICNKEVALNSLNTIPAITYKSSPTLERKMLNWIKENNISLASGTYKTNDIASAYNLVKKGIGWSIIPSIALKDFSGYVKPLTINGENYVRSTYLYYNIECENCNISSQFIKFIYKKFSI